MQLSVAQFKAMGSPCEISLYVPSPNHAQSAFSAARRSIEQLERRYSRYRPDSLLSQINQNAGSGRPTPIDPETYALFQYAEQVYHQSEARFDITSGVLAKVWDFSAGKLPTASDVAACRQLVGWPMVRVDEQSVTLPKKGMAIDLGGIVKEYAADVVTNLLKSMGFLHGLVDLGGDMRILGPRPSGTGWQIGIRDPSYQVSKSLNDNLQHQHQQRKTQAIKRLILQSGAIASSGSYERYMDINGHRYCHILNPLTGWPVEKPLQSVSVVADHCIIAGSFSTIAMLKGEEGGIQWLEESGLGYVAMTHAGRVVTNLEQESQHLYA